MTVITAVSTPHPLSSQNVKRQKSIKPLLRNREDIIRIIQAFSHACVSVSDRDDCLLCGSWAVVFLFVLSPTATGQSEGRRYLWEESVTSQRRWKLVVPDYMCQIKQASSSSSTLGACNYSHMQIVSVYRHSGVPMEAWVNVCCRLSGHIMADWSVFVHSWWLTVFTQDLYIYAGL